MSKRSDPNDPVSQEPAAPQVIEPTAEQKQQLAEALANGDYKTVTAISKAIAAEQGKAEKAKREEAKKQDEEKRKLLEDTTTLVKADLIEHIRMLIDTVPNMDKADLVSFKWVIADDPETAECKLFKAASRPAGKREGGGGGKKYGVDTKDLLEKYGDDEYKDGQTFKQAWEADSSGNARYKVRVALLKKDGVIG